MAAWGLVVTYLHYSHGECKVRHAIVEPYLAIVFACALIIHFEWKSKFDMKWEQYCARAIYVGLSFSSLLGCYWRQLLSDLQLFSSSGTRGGGSRPGSCCRGEGRRRGTARVRWWGFVASLQHWRACLLVVVTCDRGFASLPVLVSGWKYERETSPGFFSSYVGWLCPLCLNRALLLYCMLTCARTPWRRASPHIQAKRWRVPPIRSDRNWTELN